jgi:hypothetical protein
MMCINKSNNRNSLALLAFLLLPSLAAAQDFANIQITTTQVRENIYMLQGSGGQYWGVHR